MRTAGVIGLFLLAEGCGVWYLALSRADLTRPTERKMDCLILMKQLAQSILEYSTKTGKFPAAGNWADVAGLRIRGETGRSQFRECRGDSGLSSGSYAYNQSFDDLGSAAVRRPRYTVVIFESGSQHGPVGGPELLPAEPRHLGGDNYGFADGHAQWLRRRKLPNGSWAKEPDANWVKWQP